MTPNVRNSRSVLLRGLGDLSEQLGCDLGAAVEGQQSVLLLLDVGELGVAEALHRPRLHQRFDHLAICIEESLRVDGLGPAKARRTGERNATKLTHYHR